MRVVAFTTCLAMVAAPVIAQRLPTAKRESQPSYPQLTATADLRLTATALGLSGSSFGRGAHLALAPDGRIIVAPQNGDLVDLDSTGKRLSWKIQIGGKDPEIWIVDRIGWAGNNMWVIDQGFRQIAIVDRNGKVTKSLEHPSWVRPAWNDRRNFPVFSRVTPLAVYPDGSWLVIPYREKSLLDTPGYDTTKQYIMRITEGGSIQRVVARVPREQGRFFVTSGKTTRTYYIAARAQDFWAWSNDGLRIATVTANAKGPDSATFRLSFIGEKGDTLFSRLYPYTPIKISQASRDSLRDRTTGKVGALSEEEVRNLVTAQIPPFYPPVSGMVIGRDYTIWLQLRSLGEDRTWLALEPNGVPIGTVVLSKDFQIEAADRTRLWGFDRKLGQPPEVVRYRVGKK